MSMIIDGTNGITFNNATTQASAGSVLQVVNAIYSTQVGTTSNSFIDTGLTATITPKFSTSKILVIVDQTGIGKGGGSGNYIQLKLVKNSTTLAYFESLGTFTNAAGLNYIGSCSMNYLDSPATTSATTYKTQFTNGDNVNPVYVQTLNGFQASSTITLMEIAG